jgi:hypothetical protein
MENIQNNQTDKSKGYFIGRKYHPSQNYLNKIKEQEQQRIKSKEKSEYAHIVEEQIISIYTATLNNLIKKTATLYENIYYLADNQIGEIFQQIKKIMTETTTKVSTMIQELRVFLGYNFNPSKLENNKLVPIEANTIKKAWDMLKNKQNNWMAIENALMFN